MVASLGFKMKERQNAPTTYTPLLDGFAFNLQSWAREYLEENPHLLNGHAGAPMTPRQKLHSRRFNF
jgi:hypothetical protein